MKWTDSEASSVNQFLSTPVGTRWLAYLMTVKPSIDMKSTETAALTGAYVAGYEHFLSQIAATRITSNEDASSLKMIDMVRD